MPVLPVVAHLLARCGAAFLVLAVIAISAASQTKPTAGPPKEPSVPTSTVKGRVVFDDTNRPVRRAPITLVQLPERGQFSTATDREGKFVIEDMPAGVYFAFVDSPGIIAPFAFMSLTEGGPPQDINVKAIKEFCTEVAVDGK